jgi:hypothetical protein
VTSRETTAIPGPSETGEESWKFKMESDTMKNTASCSNEHIESQGQLPSEPLEVQIANRARQISQRGDEDGDKSLARWLEAAREILSGNSEKPC